MFEPKWVRDEIRATTDIRTHMYQATVVVPLEQWRGLHTLLFDVWTQFGIHKPDGSIHHGCLSTLEEVQEVLTKAGMIDETGKPREEV